jgi:uncharacterized membrane protein
MSRNSWFFLVLGVAFRCYALDKPVFWHDEVYTTIFASGYQAEDWKAELFTGELLPAEKVLIFQQYSPEQGMLSTIWGLAQDEPQHPPLYYLLLRAWCGIWGTDVEMIRALSVLFGVLALPALYWLGMGLSERKEVAETGVKLLAVSPFFVLYSQEAREYALWAFLSILSCAALLRAFRVRTVWAWGLFSLFTVLSLYTSFSAVGVILAQILLVIIQERGRFTRAGLEAVGAFAVAAVGFLPWGWLLYQHFEAFQISMAWSKSIVVPRTELVGSLILSLTRPLLDPGVDSGSPASGLLILLGLLLIARAFQKGKNPLALLLLLVPIGLLFVPDLLFGGIRSLSTRYLTPSLLGVELACACWLADRVWKRRLVLGMGILSCWYNAGQESSWIKGVSRSLPEAAGLINEAEQPVVVGNMEQHHPGNLLALARLVKPETKLQFLTPEQVNSGQYQLPEGDVFLFGPIPQFIETVAAQAKVKLLLEDPYLSLYRITLK